jgi:hypothetical protein
MGITPIMDYLPQKGGKFYTLAKKFHAEAIPQTGNDNWLSEFDNQAIWTAEEVTTWRSKHIGADIELSKEDLDNISKIPLGN